MKREEHLVDVKATLDSVGKKGSAVMFKSGGKAAKARISGSGTKITIAGKKEAGRAQGGYELHRHL